jgi:hypothetical protein
MLHAIAEYCESRILKAVFLPRLARYCSVLRPQWCQFPIAVWRLPLPDVQGLSLIPLLLFLALAVAPGALAPDIVVAVSCVASSAGIERATAIPASAVGAHEEHLLQLPAGYVFALRKLANSYCLRNLGLRLAWLEGGECP